MAVMYFNPSQPRRFLVRWDKQESECFANNFLEAVAWYMSEYDSDRFAELVDYEIEVCGVLGKQIHVFIGNELLVLQDITDGSADPPIEVVAEAIDAENEMQVATAVRRHAREAKKVARQRRKKRK